MKKCFFSLFCALALLLSAIPSASGLEGEAQRAADILYSLGLLEITADSYAFPTAMTALAIPATPAAPATPATPAGTTAPAASAGTAATSKIALPANSATADWTATASRLAAASLLVRLAGADTSQVTAKAFPDVPDAAARDVSYAASLGWVGGIRDGVFGPDQPLTANAWFTMLLRMLGYKDSAGDFAVADAAVFAHRVGISSRPYAGQLTLGDLVESGREALTIRYKDGSGTVAERLVSLGKCSQSLVNALGLSVRELTARQAADRYMSAVFCLTLYNTQEDIDAKEPSADASGFFITADGIAVTNYHSIDDAILAYATLSTGESFPVQSVLWYDVAMDLAVLRISRTSTENKATSAFAFFEIAGTSDIRPGDVVYTLSNPLGMGLAVSSGVISAIARNVERYALPCVMNTADISLGSSGGALINVYGRVVAVTSGAFRQGNNMYLAVPVDPIRTVDLTVSGKTLRDVAVEQAMLAETELSEQ